MARIEFYGVLRLRAGTSHLDVSAATVGEALAAIRRNVPALSETLLDDDALDRTYQICLNGRDFHCDLSQTIQSSDFIMLLAADAGG